MSAEEVVQRLDAAAIGNAKVNNMKAVMYREYERRFQDHERQKALKDLTTNCK